MIEPMEGTKTVSLDLPVPMYLRFQDMQYAQRQRGVATVIKTILAEYLLQHPPQGKPEPAPSPEQKLAGFITGEPADKVHDLPAKPTVVRLDALDRRIKVAADALMDEWSSGEGADPRGERGTEVREQVEALLKDGAIPADIQRGLVSWDGESPRTIPAFVSAAMSGEDSGGE